MSRSPTSWPCHRSSPPGTPTNLPPGAITRTSVVTHVEMNSGVASAARQQDPALLLRMTGSLRRLLTTWVPVPLDDRVAKAALAARQDPRRRVDDLVIAATAEAHGWTLVTSDTTLVRAVEAATPVTTLR